MSNLTEVYTPPNGATVLEVNPSKSRPDVQYYVIEGKDGVVYCTCPGWRVHKTCRHTKGRN